MQRRPSNRRRDSYPPLNSKASQVRQPQRTTKITQKLVLFPESNADQTVETDDDFQLKYEALAPVSRHQLPRVTSYCVADSFKLDAISSFLLEKHNLKSKQFDECLYFVYSPESISRLFGNGKGKDRVKFEDQPSSSHDFTKLLEEEASMERGEVFNVNSDIQTEDFYFQYDFHGPLGGRIYNDTITIKTNSALIKLAISHGLAQTVKLSLFENVMEETIEGAEPLPKMLAHDGSVPIPRTEIMKIVGNLYALKMNVNLISNVLDTPEICWSEPGLESFYSAIRSYLEISQRASLLNKRADIINDLLSMLSDHLNSNEMTNITWIVIVLICFAVIIAFAEVVVKLMRLGAGIEDYL